MPMPKVALGEDDEPAILAAWLIDEGAVFDEGDPIVEVETAKANMEVEAPQAGVLVARWRDIGDKVLPGDVLAVLADPGEDFDTAAVRAERSSDTAAPQPAEETAPAPAPVRAEAPAPPVTAVESTPAAPASRRPDSDGSAVPAVAFDSAGQLYGLPRRGRPQPGPAAASAAPVVPAVQREPLSRHRRTLAKTMVKSAAIPQFSVQRELPMREPQRAVEWLRAAGIPATLTDVVLKATAEALTRHPEVNSLFVDDDCHRYSEPAIAVAADSPAGVIAPVIRGCGQLDWADLARERKRVVDGARNGRLLPADLSGGTFSISNVGALGGDAVIPMLTPPQVAILGLGRVRPGWGGVVATGVLAADHRALDGADAARFLNTLAECLDAITASLRTAKAGAHA